MTLFMYNGTGEESMQRYFTDRQDGESFLLEARDTYHITKVMRLKEHDHIEVVFKQTCYECEIINCADVVSVHPIRAIAHMEYSPKKILLLPLLKEQKMDVVLQKTTELGIDEIILIQTERSVIKLDSKKIEKKLKRWQAIMKEAAEQSKRLTIPKLHPNIMRLEELMLEDGIKMVCSTRKPKNNVKLFLQNHPLYDKIFIAVGPEGGFTLKEENILIEKEFEPVTLGSNILRVETAPLFCLSVILYESME